MSREEALNKAIGILTYNQVNFCKSKEAVANMNEIIEALEKIDQEQCGDCISRQAVLDVIEREQFKGDAISEIEKLSSVSPMPKMGNWVEIDEDPHETWECDNCGFVIDGSGCVDPYEYRDTYNYCPNCGAKMSEIPTGSEGSEE